MTVHNPLKSLAVKNVGSIEPRGLIVIVGPNSSGKTRFLKDIQAEVIGEVQQSIVCSQIEVELPDSLDDFIEEQVKAGSIKKVTGESGEEQLQQWTPHLGVQRNTGQKMGTANLKRTHSRMHAKDPNPQYRHDLFKFFGHALITSLFLDRRLQIANEVPMVDHETSPPTNELQSLHLSKTAQQRFTDEIRQVFRKAVWLDSTRGLKLCLRIRDDSQLPSDADLRQPEEMKKHRMLDNEGDGLKSYVGICIALLLARRPICLIDEPEMCLHPPQAYAIGRFIGKNASSKTNTTFVATHSSHVLRGIVEASDQLQVLRLSHISSSFSGNLMPNEILKSCIERPSTRIETIFDGIFAEAVTVVEAEGDRLVYSAAWESLREANQRSNTPSEDFYHDVHFVSVGGTGGIAQTVELYKQLRIPTAVIADLDLIRQKDKLKAILTVLSQELCGGIVASCQAVIEEIEKIHPPLTEQGLKTILTEITKTDLDWKKGNDEQVRRKLSRTANDLARSGRLKKGGIRKLEEHPPIYHALEKIIADCRGVGLFLVPVGELEYWIPHLMKDSVSKSKKPEWANEATLQLRKNPPEEGDIWGFIQSMVKHQRAETEKLASYPV
ncbi:MAG: ATP-binding protein [Planctomycetes bacterium]|nr:ATP-binding protein [Planctomycetota bacterium]